MKILMLSWEYPPYVVGGMGRHVAELVPALARQDIEIHVVTPVSDVKWADIFIEDTITVHRVFTPALTAETDIYQRAIAVNQSLENYIRQINQKSRYDLLHTHDWLTGPAAIALQANGDLSLVVTIHATERGRNRGNLQTELQHAIDRLECQLAQTADRLIVCSRHMADEVEQFFQVADSQIIPNGVNLAHLRDGHNPAQLTAFRAEYARPEEKVVFTIARLVYEKGIHILLQAAPAILARCPQTRFIIAGKGPEADKLKQQTHYLGLADRVQFTGFISDEARNQLFQVADCAVFPSLYEPFGIVALEAMALGSSLVVSDVGGLAEIVRHGKTGIKVYPDNVESTAWGVIHALTHPDWAKNHAQRARQTVENQFTWPHIARQTIGLYSQLLLDSQS